MNIIGQNLKLRRVPESEWLTLEHQLRADLAAIEGVTLHSIRPGLLEIELTRPSARAQEATLARLRATWPDWRFSESGSYGLSTPVSMTVLG